MSESTAAYSNKAPSKRGRKPVFLCPDAAELRRVIDSSEFLSDACSHYGVPRSTMRRWMTECGMELPAPPKRRPRGESPKFVRVADGSNGRRYYSKLYRAWMSMHSRCRSTRPHYWKWYGAKGIKVCAEWSDYDAFRSWSLANGFGKGLSLDRIDGDRDYEPANCRWVTRLEQQNNTVACHRLTFGGITKSLGIWARERGFDLKLLRGRIRSGWTDEQALTIPPGECRPGQLRGRAAAKAKRLAMQHGDHP